MDNGENRTENIGQSVRPRPLSASICVLDVSSCLGHANAPGLSPQQHDANVVSCLFLTESLAEGGRDSP